MTTNKETIPRMAGEERRQQLLDVAKNLFSKNGFTGTTTKKIADKAGVSEAMVFKHFANKEELYAAILDCKSQRKRRRTAARPDFGSDGGEG